MDTSLIRADVQPHVVRLLIKVFAVHSPDVLQHDSFRELRANTFQSPCMAALWA